MLKPVAVIGTAGFVPISYKMSTPEAFAVTGHNTGNLAFQFATWQIISDQKALFRFDFDPNLVRETCRRVVLPAANFLYNGFDLGGLAARLEETKLPITVLGLGAQAFRSIDEVKLQAGTERLLKVIAERCESIVVRGKYTAQVLERYGVKNYDVLGCPSNFINCRNDLGVAISSRFHLYSDTLAFCPTFYSYNSDFEHRMAMEFGSRVTQIICQDPVAAISIARGDRNPESQKWLDESSGFLTKISPEARTAARSIFRAYFSAEAWMEGYLNVDLVIGSRIHGVNLGWQTGRPGLVVSYDLRTEELAETMGVPWCKAAELSEDKSTMSIFHERLPLAAASYDAKRTGLAQRLVTILEAADISVSQEVRELTARPKETIKDEAAPLNSTQTWGFLEQYNRRRIAGWVDTNGPDEVEIIITLNGKEAGTVAAREERPDLGPKARGFQFAVSDEILVSDVMKVEAQILSTKRHLENSPVVASFRPDDGAKVLRGKGGYLFLQNDSNDVLSQITGSRPLTSSELDAWGTFFQQASNGLKASDSNLVFFVAPAKEAVLAEFLPPEIQLSEDRPVRQLERLLDHLQLSNIRFLYPFELLKRADGGQDVYPKGDSHWTDYGAALAIDALWDLVWQGRRNEEPATTGPFKREFRNSDLLSKLGGVCVEPQPVNQRRYRGFERTSENGQINTGRLLTFRSTREDALEDLYFAHDSFGDWLMPALAQSAKTLTALWSASLPANWTQGEKKRFILIERAERFLLSPSRLL